MVAGQDTGTARQRGIRRPETAEATLAATRQAASAIALGTEVQSWLAAIEAELISLEAAIRTAQPKRDKTVLMELYWHGDACLGCPHVVWKQWRKHPKTALHRWSAHRISNPLARLPRTAGSRSLRALVTRALRLAETRSDLITRLRAVQRIVNFTAVSVAGNAPGGTREAAQNPPQSGQEKGAQAHFD